MPRIFFDDELHFIRRLVYNIVQATQEIMRCLQRESQNTHRVKTEIMTQNSEQCREYFWLWIASHKKVSL